MGESTIAFGIIVILKCECAGASGISGTLNYGVNKREDQCLTGELVGVCRSLLLLIVLNLGGHRFYTFNNFAEDFSKDEDAGIEEIEHAEFLLVKDCLKVQVLCLQINGNPSFEPNDYHPETSKLLTACEQQNRSGGKAK